MKTQLVAIQRVALSTIVLFTLPAWSTKRIVVVVGDCTQGTGTDLVPSLREVLPSGFEIETAESTVRAFGGTPTLSLIEVERLLGSARYDYYENASAERAHRTLQELLKELVVFPPSSQVSNAIRAARTLSAFMALKLNQERNAVQQIEYILRVEPHYVPDADLYPPSFGRFVERVRQRVKATAVGTVTVTSHPSSVPIFIDGLPAGGTPRRLTLPEGNYQIDAALPEGRGLPKKLTVSNALHPQHLEIDVDFENAIHPEHGPCLETGTDRQHLLGLVVKTGAAVKANEVVAIQIEELISRERYFVASLINSDLGQELRTAKIRMTPTGVSPKALGRLAEFLATGTAREPVEPVRNVSPIQSSRPHERTLSSDVSFFKRGRYWAGGAALAAIAFSGFTFIQANQTTLRMKDLCPDNICADAAIQGYEALYRTRAQHVTVGGILAGVAGGALATGFLFHLKSKTSAPAQFVVTPNQVALGVRF